MKFRRKSDGAPARRGRRADGVEETPRGRPRTGPFDVDDLPERTTAPSASTSARCCIAPEPGRELRLQVDEEPRRSSPCARRRRRRRRAARLRRAPRRRPVDRGPPPDRADIAQRGGTATEREGRFGTELLCQLTVRTARRHAPAPRPRGSSASTAPLDAARHPARPPGPRARRRRSRGSDADRRSRVEPRPGRDAGRRGAALVLPDARRSAAADKTRRPRDPPSATTTTDDRWPRRAGCGARISRWANTPTRTRATCGARYAEEGFDASVTLPTASGCGCAAPLRTVTLRPRGGVPALEAELYDGTGVDHGRLAGAAPDRRHRARPLDVRARAGSATHDGDRIIYNPRYELIP